VSALPSGGGGPPPEGDRPSFDTSPTRTHLDPLAGLAPGRVLAGRYRIEGLLGAGGMGVVYRAHDLELDIDVAVKLLRPEHAARHETRDRFRSELILARQVSHRNVVRIHDIDHDGELEFLTMDLVEGRSLRELIAEGPLAADRAMAIARQLAEALAAAHDGGVVHRDLKPANVVVDRDDRAWITDFGVARSIGGGPGATRPGALIGTVDYLSPEQARGETVDGRSDLYSLGLVLFEMLSGRQPFGTGSTAELVAQRIAGHPRSLAEVGAEAPPGLEAVIRRCLEREPARRYADARELAADLDRVAAGETTTATRRRRWRWALAAALLAVVLGVGGAAAVRLVRPSGGGAAGAPRHVVAVLPFADQTGRADLAWTSRGLAESLASSLAESPALGVVDSLRLFQMAEDLDVAPGPLSDRELRRVAELVEADRVVTGRVRTAGSEVRLDLELAAVGPGRVGTRALAESGPPEGFFDLVGRLGGTLRERLEVPPAGRPARRLSTVPAALASYSKGVEALVAGDALGAAPALERAVEADPAFTAAGVRLADAYQELGYGDKARDAARRAVATLDEGTGSRLAFEARARGAALGGEPERAVGILRQLVERYPNDVEARLALARALGQTGDFGAAEAALEKVVELDPNHPRAWFDLARYAIRRGDSRRAIDDYLVRARVIQNRLGSRQGQADVINGLGVAYHQLGDLDRAAENYAEAAELRR
jgi:Tfp pilus assembly protein PilF/TolB-like protein